MPNAPRLSASTIAIALVAILMMLVLPTPAAYADHCEVTGCWRECRPVPGGVWCRNICQRRCWRAPDPEPEYEAPPYSPQPKRRYQPPTYADASTSGVDPMGAFLVFLLCCAFIAAVIGAVASEDSATTAVVAATEETERDTAETKTLIADAEAKAREIDAHLDRFLSDATRR